MSENGIKLRFTIEEGGAERVEELDGSGAPIKIGRLSSSHLRFEDASVSRIHAVIERAGDGNFHVIDLGSPSGTWVNGEKVTKRPLTHGDRLQFGEVSARVEFVDAIEPAVSEPTQPSASALKASSSVGAGLDRGHILAPQGAGVGAGIEAPSGAGGVQISDSYLAQAGGGGAARTVTAADGSEVEPYTLQGYYDEANNYIPGYYDAEGAYQLGYGYYDDANRWTVAAGYYNAAGDWIETEHPVASAAQGVGGGVSGLHQVGSPAAPAAPSSMDYYTESFFGEEGGDTLEVAMLWADQVLAVTSYPEPRSVTVGASDKADFVVHDPALPDDAFALIAWDGSSYRLQVTERMGGVVQESGGERRALGGERASVELRPGVSARVDVGSVTFLAHFTDQPVFVGGPVGFDKAPLGYIGASAVAHIAFVLLALINPAAPGSLELDGFNAEDRFVQALIMPDQEEEEEPDWMGDGAGDEAAEKHAGEEGEAGKEDSEQENKQLAIKGPKDNEDLQLKKAQDREVALNAGVFAALGDQVASPFGSATESIGSDAIHALGNIQGDGIGEARGFGGLGMAGSGRGGGGISERGVGLANVGTKGKGGRGGSGGGYGRGVGNLGERGPRTPKIVPGKPTVMGSLDKEIIRRVVRKHRNQIRFCYEKELQKNPKLAGQVKVKFVISGTGSVMSAVVASSSLKNSRTESCMTGKIRRWVFPEPKGGGIVRVTYPFNFSS